MNNNTNKSYKFEARYFDKYFQKFAVKLLHNLRTQTEL